VQILQAGKLGRKAAGAGGVDHEQRLAFEVLQLQGLAIDGGGVKVKSGGHAVSLWMGKVA
jgi:hypothetical protein